MLNIEARELEAVLRYLDPLEIEQSAASELVWTSSSARRDVITASRLIAG
jgi:hypothetical protein